MTQRQAIKILMLSPVYYRLEAVERIQLIKEYCRLYEEVRKIPKNRSGNNS